MFVCMMKDCFPNVQNMTKAVQAVDKQQSLVKVLEQDKRILEHEISGYCQEVHKQRTIIQQLEKDRDRHINHTSSLMQKAGGRIVINTTGSDQTQPNRLLFTPQVQQKISDVEVRETEICDWRKKVTEAECKLKQQENQLESVVLERNLYSKNLVMVQVGVTAACFTCTSLSII